MTIPPHIARIAEEISVTAYPGTRATLKSYLAGIEASTSDELFKRCLKKAGKALHRYEKADQVWLNKWLPIIFKTIKDRE